MCGPVTDMCVEGRIGGCLGALSADMCDSGHITNFYGLILMCYLLLMCLIWFLNLYLVSMEYLGHWVFLCSRSRNHSWERCLIIHLGLGLFVRQNTL